jgi:hypothetical protein
MKVEKELSYTQGYRKGFKEAMQEAKRIIRRAK